LKSFLLAGGLAAGLTAIHAAPPSLELDSKAGASYPGDGLVVQAGTNGARLRCVFQKLEGQPTAEGLWLVSTVTNAASDRFRVVAIAVGRGTASTASDGFTPALFPNIVEGVLGTREAALSRNGLIEVRTNLARLVRPGLVEEYSVSMEGVRQDFVVLDRPQALRSWNASYSVGENPADRPVEGELRVELAVTGATVEPTAYGVQLMLRKSGRKIAYNRLRVTDASGRELPARMKVEVEETRLKSTGHVHGSSTEMGLLTSASQEASLAVLVDDADAMYPIRVDPTFSDANWISMGGLPGANGDVYASVVDDVGNLYIGGVFTIVGDVFARNIAKWNGSSWSALGSGVDNRVLALAVSGSNLYAGGNFTIAGGGTANYIAKWNGSCWSAVGEGVDDSVYALAVSGTDLYAGGDFTMAGGSAASRIAKWNGNNWSALGPGIGGYVYALAVSGSNVYAGGNLSSAGDTNANYIARWNGSSWSALNEGMGPTGSGHVYALAVSGSELYAGGYFTTAGGSAANRVAKWDGSWSALGEGTDWIVSTLAVSGSDLFAAGQFSTAGGSAASYIAKLSGGSWSGLDSRMNLGVKTLAVSGNILYAGGSFTAAGGNVVNRIAKWNETNWSALGSGINNEVNALAVSDRTLYVGGFFTTATGSVVNRVAKWNQTNWNALGSGMNHEVYVLATSGNDLYAGGSFTTADGSTANRVAKWDGIHWTALGEGIGDNFGSVYALVVSGSNVYAAGSFTTAGGITANRVAHWDGRSWSALGEGMDDYVFALVLAGSDLYAGGRFTKAGGNPANRVAKWDGSNWSALGSGMNGDVYVLAFSGNDFYAGGRFTTADGSPAQSIAKWNGNSWSGLGEGIGGGGFVTPAVSGLALSGSDLYAGGAFTTAGGSAANYIAKWNGSCWSALGLGMGGGNFPNYGTVNVLAVSGSDLYAGGKFTTAGGKVSAYLARAYLLPTLSILRSGVEVTISWPTFYEKFALQQNPNAANTNSWSNANYLFTTNGTIKSATFPLTPTNQFFRLIGN
jgi:hypothetical protein